MVKMYNVTLAANKLGIKYIKAGVTGKSVDNICRKYIAQKFDGYDFPHGTGHGVGMLIHEEPRVNRANTKPLPENSVVTIEPGVYFDNIGGVRVEDTVVVTKTGCKVLTRKAPK
jgi:Xaa-Pro aminopeptidase